MASQDEPIEEKPAEAKSPVAASSHDTEDSSSETKTERKVCLVVDPDAPLPPLEAVQALHTLKNTDEINISFMTKGHSHSDIDRLFSSMSMYDQCRRRREQETQHEQNVENGVNCLQENNLKLPESDGDEEDQK